MLKEKKRSEQGGGGEETRSGTEKRCKTLLIALQVVRTSF